MAPSQADVFDWRQTVRLEHADRKARFERLTKAGAIGTPLFYDELISGRDLPQFGVDIPVLRIVFPQRVYFDTDQTAIRPEGERLLDLIAENMRRDVPDVALFIAGHADARGGDEYNYLLSVARSEAVARALVGRGIGSARVWRIGFGEAVPAKANTTIANMAENRRVEFLFAAKAEAVAVWLSRRAATICADADAAVKGTCTERIALLPAILAEPVLNDAPVEVSAVDSPRDASLQDETSSAAVSGATSVIFDAQTAVAAEAPPEEAQVVEIARDTPVIIHMSETRVEIPMPMP